MDKSWDTFEFLGRFPIHTYPAPPLTPQTTLDACCGIFSPVSTLYRVGEGKLQENFEKDALFHDSLCTNNLSSPQIFTEGRRESVHRLFYEGAQKLEKVMNTFLCDKRYICENEMISMSRTRDEEKNVRIRTYDLLNTRRALYPLSYGELMESEAIY